MDERARTTHRRSVALQMQQQALFQLIVAGVVLFAVVLGAAYFTLAPLGARSPRAVAPVLGRFMQAGAERDVLLGHSLLSVGGLLRYDRDDIAALFADRELFEGYERLQVRSMTMQRRESEAEPERAIVEAGVLYAGLPPSRLSATMALEPSGWQIEAIQLWRDVP